jgi:hypothetical protein
MLSSPREHAQGGRRTDTPGGAEGEDSDRHPPLVLLVAAALEAVFLTVFLGYAASYARLALGAGDLVASLATALPTFAIFLGSLLWGRLAPLLGLKTLLGAGLVGYLAFGVGTAAAVAPIGVVLATSLASLATAALRPATSAYLTLPGGRVGLRLGILLRWQSLGWLIGGAGGGFLLNRDLRVYPTVLLALGLLLGGLVPLLLRLEELAEVGWLRTTAGFGIGRVALAVLASFLLLYAGYEGFWANLGIYLHGYGVPVSWVGYTVAIGTSFGWFAGGAVGHFADRVGGLRLYTGSLALYVLAFAAAAAVPGPVGTLVAFSLPLFPSLQVGAQRALAEVTDKGRLPEAMGAYNGVSGVAVTLGTMLIGAFDALVGPASAPGLTCALMLAGLLGLAVGVAGRPRPSAAGAGGQGASAPGTIRGAEDVERT